METTTVQTGPNIRDDLEKIYKARFSGMERYRNEIWRILVRDYFSKWISPGSSVLDLGCGYCEFIANIPARKKFGMDLNPLVREKLPVGVTLLEQDCSLTWPLEENSLDVVFTSNFFEHLPDKQALQKTLMQAHRCLRPSGRIIAMGPNVRYLAGRYWDFFDHHIPLTEASLAEVLKTVGFKVELAKAKFLPYTMSMKATRPPVWTTKLYLRMPLLWQLFGRQFLVIAAK